MQKSLFDAFDDDPVPELILSEATLANLSADRIIDEAVSTDDEGSAPMKSAEISGCRRFRYFLSRGWDMPGRSHGVVNWIMLNPSTADAMKDDPTIAKIVKFSKAWGFGTLWVTNLFAFRATDPAALAELPPAIRVGSENDDYIRKAANVADLVICAWGANRTWGRDEEVFAILRSLDVRTFCLKVTKDGHPTHPLYQPDASKPIPYDRRSA